MDDRREERPLGQLLGDLSRQMTTLVRQEIELARTEMTSTAGAAGRDAALIGLGGAFAYAGLLGLMAAVILALSDAGVQPWLAAAIVAFVFGVIGAFLIVRGRAGLAASDLAPRRTVETIKDDAEFAKERLR
jgi:uncharacterized membrane protein YqjE